MRLSPNLLAGLLAVVLGAGWSIAAAQDHPHTAGVSGLPTGVPLFCASPTVTSASNGPWSNPRTWSTGKVPVANDKVAIAAGHAVTYDAVSDGALDCIEVRGTLAFRTDASTRLHVVTLTVLDGGALEVGRQSNPIAANVTAEIVIADRPFDPQIDPSQAGNGVLAFGKVTMHGAAKTPTFVRFGEEPLAGATTLVLEKAVEGWRPGDTIVVPDTRQLRANESG